MKYEEETLSVFGADWVLVAEILNKSSVDN